MAYDKDKIHNLTLQYLESPSQDLLQQILFEVTPMVRAQLCTKYQSVLEYHEDLESECVLKIIKVFTDHIDRVKKMDRKDQFFWYLIKDVLYKYTTRNLKHNLKGRGYDSLNPELDSDINPDDLIGAEGIENEDLEDDFYWEI